MLPDLLRILRISNKAKQSYGLLLLLLVGEGLDFSAFVSKSAHPGCSGLGGHSLLECECHFAGGVK
jgi:hypothetical protein